MLQRQEPQALFTPDIVDAARLRRELTRSAPADIRYVIWFTPRSGSSWLTDIATRTGQLSQPGECFNPSFIPDMAKKMNAGNMNQFIQLLMRRRNTHGVFGCQLTWYHLKASFGRPGLFMRHFRDDPCFWLIREDVVLQAVSLARKKQTRIGHTTLADDSARAEAEQSFCYDSEEIRHFVRHLMTAEDQTEAMFARFGQTPLRLSYEQITGMGAEAVVNVIARHIGADPIHDGPIETGHGKLGTDRNAEFATRFREDHAGMMREIDDARAGRIAAIDRSLPDSLPEAFRPRG